MSMAGCASEANGDSLSPRVSPDGRYVAFQSSATNLVNGDTNDFTDVFVRDLADKTTQRVSVSGSGTQANGGSVSASINASGVYVAFSSDATNLVGGDTNGFTDVFVHERGNAPQPSSDCVAPTTTRTFSPLPNANGWNNSNVTVTLSAQDNEGGSGVKEIRYSATGAQSIPETVYDPQNPPIINTEGTTTITYFATDNAGNRESPAKTLTVKIDKGAPSAPVITSPANNSFDTDGTITISGTAEANSTLEVFEATASGDTSKGTTQVDASGAWTKTISGVSDGSHTYKAKAKDPAENTSGFSNSRTVTVDTVKPQVSSTTPPTPLAGSTNVGRGTNLTATFSEKMRTSSINTTTFKLFKVNSGGTQTQITDVVVSLSSADGLTATLNPFGAKTTLLARNTKYKGVITTGTKDLAGNSLAQQKSWTFTTKP